MKDEKDFQQLLNHLNEKNLEEYAHTHLSKEKQQKLQQILSDKKKLNAVLHTRQAQELVKKLKGKDYGNQ